MGRGGSLGEVKKEKALGIPALFYFDSDRWCGLVNAFKERSVL
jgi:glutaredoxin-related protein